MVNSSLPAAGVEAMEQVAPLNVQEVGDAEPFCASLQLTVPVAATASPLSTLFTVAVHVVLVLT